MTPDREEARAFACIDLEAARERAARAAAEGAFDTAAVEAVAEALQLAAGHLRLTLSALDALADDEAIR